MDRSDPPLHIGLLGELRVVRDGQVVPLPASKKTRALLGYLVATGQPHRRDRLCDLLWDGPDDPRAELRWSASKLRPLLNTGATVRLATDRERIGFRPQGASIDLAEVRSLVGGGIAASSLETLQDAAGRFRGEFLDGLDLPICYRFQEWCMAEREAASRLHVAILDAVVERLEERPEEALPYARALAAADPLAEAGHVTILRLLTRLGRKREALIHYEYAQRLLETELGAPTTNAFKAARPGRIAAPTGAPPGATGDSPSPREIRPIPTAPFVGRIGERALVDDLVAATTARGASGVVLVTGEPGIGKSHFLSHLRDALSAAGGAAFGARAFEAEAARPYGIWIDLVRAMTRDRAMTDELRDLGPLLPELGAPSDDPGNRTRLFDAVVDLLRRSAAERAMIVTLDDLQWCDEASAALLHYVCRQFASPSALLIAGAARAGEIDDNVAMSGVRRALERGGQLLPIELGPLDVEETAELALTVDGAVDAARIFVQSRGNPLFTIELAGAHALGEVGAGRTVELVIEGQLGALKARTRDLLVWAAAWERGFTLDNLARVAGFDPAELLAALDELERRGIVRPVGEATYEFVHDLTRLAAYRGISQPRRALIHRHIARALMGASTAEAALAGDAVHHAALGGDDALAARACVLAGERALRVFANVEASSFARRGLRHVTRLPHGPPRAETTIALLKIRVHAATGAAAQSLPTLATEVSSAVGDAEALGLYEAAATGHYLLSVVHQSAGDRPLAEASSLRAAEVGRLADQATQIHQLANTARCLLELETQIERSRLLVGEAEIIANSRGIRLCELSWARGLLHRWDGEDDLAAGALEAARIMAARAEDHWREYKCLTWLATLALERGRFADALTHCAALAVVARRLGDEHAPFVVTLQALAESWLAGQVANEAIDAALELLRTIDDKSFLAYALNAAATLDLRFGEPAAAAEHAREAMALGAVMGRQNEVVVAQTLLACAGNQESAREIDRLRGERPDGNWLSARTRAAIGAEPGSALPTTASTVLGLLCRRSQEGASHAACRR